MAPRVGDRAGLALTLNTLADALLDQGDTNAALPLVKESLAIDCDLNDAGALVYLVEDYSDVAAAVGQALRLAAFAETLRNKIGAPARAWTLEEALKTIQGAKLK